MTLKNNSSSLVKTICLIFVFRKHTFTLSSLTTSIRTGEIWKDFVLKFKRLIPTSKFTKNLFTKCDRSSHLRWVLFILHMSFMTWNVRNSWDSLHAVPKNINNRKIQYCSVLPPVRVSNDSAHEREKVSEERERMENRCCRVFVKHEEVSYVKNQHRCKNTSKILLTNLDYCWGWKNICKSKRN